MPHDPVDLTLFCLFGAAFLFSAGVLVSQIIQEWRLARRFEREDAARERAIQARRADDAARAERAAEEWERVKREWIGDVPVLAYDPESLGGGS